MIRYAVRHPVSTLTAAGALVALGVFSLFQLPVSLLPRMERPAVRITITSPERSQEHLLEEVVEPLEPKLLSIEGATSVRSLVRDGRAVLHLESDWFVEPDRLHIEVERRLSDVRRDADVEYTVEMRPADRSPVVEVVVTGGGSAGGRTEFVQDLLSPALGSLQGAAGIDVIGLAPRHVVVTPQAAELSALGMSATDRLERLGSVGVPFPVGEVRRGGRVSPLVVEQSVGSLDELRRLPLGGPGDARLGDVADIGVETITTGGFARIDGDDALLIRVYRAPGANGIALVERVREVIEGFGQREGEFRLRMVHDRSVEIVRALELLGLAALVGLMAGAIVLRLMLGVWRHAVSLAVIVPGASFAAFTAFYFCGVSLNLISLSGLGLAVGLLVDSAIVVLESIESARAAGESDPEVTGTQRVAGAVVAAFLTTAVVFLPLVYLTGLARAFFGIQAFAIVTSLMFALLLSLTLTPVLSRSRGRGTHLGAPGLESYRRILRACLRHPGVMGLASGLVLVMGGVALAGLPRELMPSGEGREVRVVYNLPGPLEPELQVELGRRLADQVAAAVAPLEPDLVVTAQAPVDRLAEPDRPTGEIVLRFAESARARAALERLRSGTVAVAGMVAEASPRLSALVEAAQWAGGRYELLATAATPAETAELAHRLRDQIRTSSALRLAPVTRSEDREVLRLDLAPSAAGQIDSVELRRQVTAGLGDVTAGWVDIPGIEPEIVLRPTDAARLELLPVRGERDDAVVPVGAWTTLGEERRAETLERENGRWAARIPVLLPGAGALGELDRVAKETSREGAGVVSVGGEAWELRRSFRQLILLLALSLFLVFLTVTALYESIAVSAVVMATIPLGLAGSVLLLAVTGQSLNVMSFLGLVLMAGIVVNNSIVLIHRAEQLRSSGVAPPVALADASSERYRPILITTLTTLVGMIPLALLGGEGVELRRSLSVAVVGGLVTSTLASLVLVPTLYRLVYRDSGDVKPEIG